MGAPGTGKTLLARAVAGESGVPFYYVSASEFVEMFVGVGASRIRDAFQTAKKTAPSILFIDEIDAIGRERGAGLGGGQDEREQTLNQILVEMDGFEREARVIVIAATNRPDILDSALLRPGRFDRQVVLDLPDINDREAILKIHSVGKPIDKNADLRKVAVRTPGFSGADLANLMNEAAILAARENRKEILQNDLFQSVEKVLLGPERKNRAISLKEKEITAYHEAGHALVTVGIKGTDPIHKISIISRGRAGGYTMKLPTEEIRLKTRSQFVSEIATLMGGYAAEQEIFGEMSTGASNDLKEASKIARALVTQYGMSEKMGPITFGETQELIFLGKEMSSGKNYSEQVAAEIDKEVKSFIDRAYKAAQKILKTHKKILDKIAKTLIEKETLEQEEFYKLIKEYNLKPIEI
jgi:cell division protease FtsH